jgi:hypothetical protein
MPSATLRVALAVLLFTVPRLAHPCSMCSRGDPLAPAAEGQGRGGDLRLAIDGEILSQRSGTAGERSMHDVLDQYTMKITGAYSPIPSVNLVASLPYARKKMAMDHGGGFTFPVTDLTGIGDVEAGVRWFFWERVNMRARLRQGVALSLGTSFPTGASDARMVFGLPNAQHEQIGTGAFGPYAGLSYRLQRDPFAALVSVSGRTHTENKQGYRYGSALLFTVQGQWTQIQWLALGIGLEGHDGTADRLAAKAVENTGGLVLWLSPSVYVNVYRQMWITLRAQLPFQTANVGDQAFGPVVLAGVQYVLF